MANELKHQSKGSNLTQAEFEHIDLHVFDGQATGDMLYASSATQLRRLAIGSANDVLHIAGGIPVWSATLAGLTLTSPVLSGLLKGSQSALRLNVVGYATIRDTGDTDYLSLFALDVKVNRDFLCGALNANIKAGAFNNSTLALQGWDEGASALQDAIKITAENPIEVTSPADTEWGWFGVAAVGRQTGYAIPTDLATCITALTTLRTALNNYGLTTVV